MAHRKGASDREERRGPSQRQLRVGEEIRRVVSRAFERAELHDPFLYELSLTISEVSLSPDMRQATVWYVPLGGEVVDAKALQQALDRASGRLSGIAARELQLKYAPRLTFKPDTAFDTSMRIEALLQNPQVRADVERSPEAEDAEAGEDQGSVQDAKSEGPDGQT